MSGWIMRAAASVCLALCATTTLAESLTLVHDGASDYAVLISGDASPSERWAAKELVDHIRQMSGVTLTVRRGGPLPAKAIVLGFGSATETLGVTTDDSLGDEGYVIRTVGDRLVVAGGRLRGTLYGVYTLLETLGVRWWTPTESTIPHKTRISVPHMNARDVPRLAYRDMMGGELWAPAGKLWMARNKLNGMSWESGPDEKKLGGRYEYVGRHFLHGLNALMTSSGVSVTDEMWSLVGGQRRPGSQPCLTNPDVLAAVTASVIRELKTHPEAKFVAMGHEEERFGYCQCETCRAVAAREGPSGLLIQFANQVADAAAKEVPGGRIAASAYAWSCNPPKNLRPRDNVIIAYDPLSCDYAHPLSSRHDDDADIEGDYAAAAHYFYRIGENKRIRREIEGWSRITDNLILYDYTASIEHPAMPYPDLHVLASNVRYYADHGFTGIFVIGSLAHRASEFYGLRMWVLAKALWNPHADGQTLIAEFLKGYYGPAAPAIQRYIDVMHARAKEHKNVYLPFLGNSLGSVFLQPEVIAEAEHALRTAEDLAAGNPELTGRVRHAHMPIWYVLAKRGPGSMTWRLAEAKTGRMDIGQVDAGYRQVRKERGSVRARPASELGPPFTDWLHDYAALIADHGLPVPPELRNANPQTYRLVQACQMDGSATGWQRADGASDGWCEVLERPTFGVQRGLMDGEEYVRGRRYRVYARIKGQGSFGNNTACVVRVFSANGKNRKTNHRLRAWQMSMGLTAEEAARQTATTRTITGEELADGKFHVFEIADVTDPTLFTMNVAAPHAKTTKVLLDCFWLQEAPPAP